MVGVEATTPDGPLRVNAALTVAADGRDSAVRDSLGLVPVDYGVPIDVLWFRVPRPTKPMRDTLANIRGGSALVTIPRPGYFQCGLLIRKGTFPEFQQEGITAFRRKVAGIAPRLTDATAAIDLVCAVVLPRIRPILARIVGYGFRPERIARGVLRPRR